MAFLASGQAQERPTRRGPVRHRQRVMFEDLNADASPAMRRFWSDYRQRVQCVRDGTVVRLPAAPRAGNFGRLSVFIYTSIRDFVSLDGHERAARREAAWYGF